MGKNIKSKKIKTVKIPSKKSKVLQVIPYKGVLGLVNDIAITGVLLGALGTMSILLIMLAEKITITVGK
jgi:hypothetical protein